MKDKRLNWQNLRRNKCPKCNAELGRVAGQEVITCRTGDLCEFAITEERMSEITNKMNKEAMQRSMFKQSEEVQDLRKSELCRFCGQSHPVGELCAGFGN